MLRDTMISTMPVAMMAIDVLWTDRFQRLRAVKKSPPDSTLNPIQMTAIATTIPTNRVSSSADARFERHVGVDIVPPVVGTAACTSVIVTLSDHRPPSRRSDRPLAHRSGREGHVR